MELKNQVSAIKELKRMAELRKQSILIAGPIGAGKTYIAREYAKYCSIADFIIVEPKMNSIKEAIEASIGVDNEVVICIENIDEGVEHIAFTLLKFIEEPPQNVFIVITCRNVTKIPDTIMNRCMTVHIPAMMKADLYAYMETAHDNGNLALVKSKDSLVSIIKSIADIDTVLKLSADDIRYIDGIGEHIKPYDSVSTCIWKIQKFPSGSQIPIHLMLRYMIHANPNWATPCIECLNTIENSRISTHAALAKLFFDIKYMR